MSGALKVGVGLRPKHYAAFLEGSPRVDFLEAISENFMGLGGRPVAVLERARAERPVFLHGVSLGIASADPLDPRYLASWKELITRVEPAVVSDHLCWGRAHGRYAHDLLPVPFTREALEHVVSRVQQVQDFLGRRLTLENVSSYLTFEQSELSEWDFLAEVARRSGCGVLLDVNNVFVSSRNHGFDPDAFLAALPRECVTQLHLAGHQRRPEVIIDTHDGPVSDEVWQLYARARALFGDVPTLLEWDDAVPELDVLLAEAEKARHVPIPAPVGSARGRSAEARGEFHPPGAATRDLREVQGLVFEAVTAPSEVSAAAAGLVTAHGELTPKQRLELYADMYWLRMRDVLRDAFPRTRTREGDERFEGLVADFLRAQGSTHFSLDRVGAGFSRFLGTALAALEWARTESFVALDAPVLDFTALQERAPDTWAGLALALHPSVRLLELAGDPTAVFRAGGPGELDERPCALVVWRQGFEVFHAPLPAAELAALRAAAAGASLLEVLAPFGEDAAAAFEALQSWFHEGMVSRLQSAPARDRAD